MRARRVADGDTTEVRRELERVYQIADDYLLEIASLTGGVLHRADRIEDLPSALARIAAELRQQYMLGYYPVKDDEPGERAITVTVSRPGVTIRARRSYTAPARR